ncbi:unnamed protein product [Musa hybrid cultivar]
MSKIHPTVSKIDDQEELTTTTTNSPSVWTVWKKSSMGFHGSDGFSIYDAKGRLAFRVDNYSRKHKCFAGEILLMDGDGKAVMALRPQILSMHDRWSGFKGEDDVETSTSPRVFSMRRRSVLQGGDEAEVFMDAPDRRSPEPDFRTEGRFRRRNCKIMDRDGQEVARIFRKEVNESVTLSDDVFSLIIQPNMDAELIMAFLVTLRIRSIWRHGQLGFLVEIGRSSQASQREDRDRCGLGWMGRSEPRQIQLHSCCGDSHHGFAQAGAHKWRLVRAHGTAVGLPTEDDMGNSEVGHNALGAGRIFAQGAKLVDLALASGKIYEGKGFKYIKECFDQGTLHLIGLLSDGGVHSRLDQLQLLLKGSSEHGAKRIRVHVLTDGCDVLDGSSVGFVETLENDLAKLREKGVDAQIASGGG